MYIPDDFRVDDIAVAQSTIRQNPFAILVSNAENGPFATHLPTVYKSEPAPFGRIEAHFARANDHWRRLGKDEHDCLAIFSGPHQYIRPGWYPSKAETAKVVPTWNYATVHAYGRVEIIADPDALLAHVSELSAQQERGREQPWSVSDAPESFTKVMLRGIVGLRMVISRLECKHKMSQNRPDQDRLGVIDGLRESDREADHAVAGLVEGAMDSSRDKGER